uniref:hypothetical protein n=1 Tax=Alistipes sp. D31t1_170403_E11 TaxID=2787128 RepID=UPI00189BBE23|nr:hypothetical protein [Alistipes sp. D31t1_170403_E11]
MSKISNVDKILSIFNSALGIGSTTFVYIWKPEYFNFVLIAAISLIVLTILRITYVNYKQKRINNELTVRINYQDEKIKKQNEHIALLEKLINVPFFKKWNLIYTFLWRSSKDSLKNNVSILETHISRTLSGKGKIKDNNLVYRFTGEFLDKSKVFKICIAGIDHDLTLEDIEFTALDIRTNEVLFAQIEQNRRDNIVKDIVIFFKEEKKQGSLFEIELKWKWPKTAFSKSDYFSFPNIYAINNKKILMDFKPADDMKLKKVEIWKYGIDDGEPEFVSHVYPQDGIYNYEIVNPEMNADYILYYE